MAIPASTNSTNGVPESHIEALDGADPMATLKKCAKRLKKLVRGARGKDLRQRPAPEAWSACEVLAHLADHEFMFGARLRLVASHDRPALMAYDQRKFADRLGGADTDAEELLAAFDRARAANLSLLHRLPDEAWVRVGVHAERGEVTLGGLVLSTAGHDTIHVKQLERTLEGARALRRANKSAAKTAAKAGRKAAKSAAQPRGDKARAEKAERPARAAKREKSASQTPVATG